MALKSETISLAVITELPLIIVDVQRAGPSTGMPTKTEQADLLMAMYGRHGEAPLPVLAIASPADAFGTMIEAVRLALKYMTPVIVLSDGYIANSAEPWLLPDLDALPDISVPFVTAANGEGKFLPYLRDPQTLARGWAVPGTPGLEHRVGGLEKEDVTGEVSHDPANHEQMVALRERKVAGIAADIPELRGGRRPRSRTAGHRLGIHLPGDLRRGAPGPGPRGQRGPGPPAAPQPLPPQPGGGACGSTPGCWCPN